jgi:hypothetical protein
MGLPRSLHPGCGQVPLRPACSRANKLSPRTGIVLLSPRNPFRHGHRAGSEEVAGHGHVGVQRATRFLRPGVDGSRPVCSAQLTARSTRGNMKCRRLARCGPVGAIAAYGYDGTHSGSETRRGRRCGNGSDGGGAAEGGIFGTGRLVMHASGAPPTTPSTIDSCIISGRRRVYHVLFLFHPCRHRHRTRGPR